MKHTPYDRPPLGTDQGAAADDSLSSDATVAAFRPARTTTGDEEDTNAVTATAGPTTLMPGGRGRPVVRKWTAALGADARRGGREMMQGSMEPGLESVVSNTLDGQLGDRDEVDPRRGSSRGLQETRPKQQAIGRDDNEDVAKITGSRRRAIEREGSVGRSAPTPNSQRKPERICMQK